MGEEGEDEQVNSCVTVPPDMVNNRLRRFRCPQCLSEAPSSLPDYLVETQVQKYIINRGSRSTRRIASRASLALLIFYLDNQESQARSLMDQVSSALRVFEVEVISHMRVIGSQVDDNKATSIHRQYITHLLCGPPAQFRLLTILRLVFDGPYHLAVVFLTEASPDGGWWISSEDSEGGAGLAPEKVFLRYHIKALTKLANNARSARLFMLSCGTNLFAASCLESIYKTVGSSCCAHELHVAIFTDQRKTRKVHGTVIMEEEWDLSKKDFRFDPARMVRMVQLPERRGGKEIQRPRHEAPWTQAGQEAREATTSDVAGSIV
ncbi:hypothetical protein RhiTH_011301 [Rhizoctonia solani]